MCQKLTTLIKTKKNEKGNKNIKKKLTNHTKMKNIYVKTRKTHDSVKSEEKPLRKTGKGIMGRFFKKI